MCHDIVDRERRVRSGAGSSGPTGDGDRQGRSGAVQAKTGAR
jgi:hypothetical protein